MPVAADYRRNSPAECNRCVSRATNRAKWLMCCPEVMHGRSRAKITGQKPGLQLWYLNGSDETQVGGNRMDMGWQQQNWLADNAELC